MAHSCIPPSAPPPHSGPMRHRALSSSRDFQGFKPGYVLLVHIYCRVQNRCISITTGWPRYAHNKTPLGRREGPRCTSRFRSASRVPAWRPGNRTTSEQPSDAPHARRIPWGVIPELPTWSSQSAKRYWRLPTAACGANAPGLEPDLGQCSEEGCLHPAILDLLRLFNDQAELPQLSSQLKSCPRRRDGRTSP